MHLKIKARIANIGDVSKLYESPTGQVVVKIEQVDPIVGDSIADVVDPWIEFHEIDHMEKMADDYAWIKFAN